MHRSVRVRPGPGALPHARLGAGVQIVTPEAST